MNFTTCQVRPGDTSATFTITLPKPAGLATVNQKVMGKPKTLTFTPVGDRTVIYDFTYWVEYKRNRFDFVLHTHDALKNKPASSLDSKFRDHFRNVGKTWPLNQTLPHLYYDDDEVGHERFVLQLPPRTALYSSSEYFFIGLGFGTHKFLRQNVRNMTVNRIRSDRQVWGFFNNSNEAMDYQGEEMSPGTAMNVNVGIGQPLPANMTVVVELLNSNRHVARINLPAATEHAATPGRAERLISFLLERVVASLEWGANPFEVVAEPNNVLTISNNAIPNSEIRFFMRFSDEFAEMFGLDAGHALSFDFDLPKKYELRLQPQQDPLAGKKPVMLKTNSFGPINSFVDGSGYQAVLGVILDYSDRHGYIIYSTGMVFDTDKTYLTIEFLDKNRQPIKFKQMFDINMMMTFKSL